MQIHEPSPISAERTNSTLNPGTTPIDSAAVALRGLKTPPHGSAPSSPRLTTLVQAESSNSKVRHPLWSFGQLTQLVSDKMNWLPFLYLSSRTAMMPA